MDARRDPERAAEAAAHYLKDLYVRFGSWPLAFASYNAGYGAVLQSIARYNTNDFWELRKHEAGLPWETTLYVPKILAAAIVGNNLQAFGFDDIVMDAPLAYEQVTVPSGTSLSAVARAARVPEEEIEGLNPELIRGRTPPDREPQAVRIPPGTGAGFLEALSNARKQTGEVRTVVLRYGETLEDVAKRYDVSVSELRRLNRVNSSREVRGGTTIVVPDKPAALAASPSASERALAEASAPGDASQDEAMLVAVPQRTFSYPGRERVFYRIGTDDQLPELSGVFGVSADNLVEWNNLDADARLQTGMIIQVFVPTDFDSDAVALLDPAHLKVVTLGSEEFLELQAAMRGRTRLLYEARDGDTLAKIARRYGLAPGDLARINRFSFNTELGEGQKIVVYSPTPDMPHERMGRRAPRPPSASQRTPGAQTSGGRTAGKSAVPARPTKP